MKGKEKCKALKEIRRQIAENNDIPFVVSQCTHQGDCKGTCPKCESELRYLERELAIRQGLGKAVAIAGISIGACATFTACSPMDTVTDFLENIGRDELAGDVEIAPSPDDEISGGLEEFDFSTPPEGDFTGMETDAPDKEEDDTLAGNVVPFEWEDLQKGDSQPETGEAIPEISGAIPVAPTETPGETTPTIEGDISLEP